MSKPLIVVGDTLDHGGRVVSGSNETDINGKAVARVGDWVICSEHGQNTIVSGDSSLIIDGRPVARHGDKTACGGTLLSSQSLVFLDYGGGHQSSALATKAGAASTGVIKHSGRYDLVFAIKNESTGQPVAGVKYRVVLEFGAVFEGVTDENGLTDAAYSIFPEIAKIEVADYAEIPKDIGEPCSGETCDC